MGKKLIWCYEVWVRQGRVLNGFWRSRMAGGGAVFRGRLGACRMYENEDNCRGEFYKMKFPEMEALDPNLP